MADSGSKAALMIAAPSSGSGKTLLTLAHMRCFKKLGIHITRAKAGPDYIDPAFHGLASGSSSVNLDPWAMDANRLKTLIGKQKGSRILVEAMMGLFDGAADGTGSAADLAQTLACPIILVVDASKQSHSIAALIEGFANHKKEVFVAGVILNKVGSARHEAILKGAIEKIDIPVLGVVYRNETLKLPERHLGLVQAGEQDNIEAFIENASKIISNSCNLDAIIKLASPVPSAANSSKLPPLGQKIAIAKDNAFSFIYPHLISDWKEQGAEISFFSPLANEGPSLDADAVFLPGGYPELYAGKLSATDKFKSAMHHAKSAGKLIYGECGGYMVLGKGIVDAQNNSFAMLGLLNLETSFAKRKLHLGYRKIKALLPFVMGQYFFAHEFHYTSAIEETGERLFSATDALGDNHTNCGLRDENVMGSYMHIIDGADNG